MKMHAHDYHAPYYHAPYYHDYFYQELMSSRKGCEGASVGLLKTCIRTNTQDRIRKTLQLTATYYYLF